jgi:CheY-like chemotaxis protein/HPt (histidine-containing phosphotransfer) domain-containing protein
MLATYGIYCVCVESAQEAIDLIRKGHPRFDIVFMDHLMPGIDGIAATQIIREKIGTDYAHTLPVIALTANALAGQEQRFLESGFNGFLAKPVEAESLDEILARWLRPATAETEDTSAAAPHFAGHPGFDQSKLQSRFGASVPHILSTYAKNVRQILEKLPLDNLPDGEELLTLAHGLKGASYTVFAAEVGALAEEVEMACRAGNFAEAREKVPTLVEKATKLVSGI